MYSVDCVCGWHFGPSSQHMVEHYAAFHLQVHELEDIALS
jgi:hypothetical protein